MTQAEIATALEFARAMLGKPYLLGAKWDLRDMTPTGPIDCSGFVCAVVFKAGTTLPEGSYNQVKVCTKLPASQQQKPPVLSLGFYAHDGVNVDHVVIVFNETEVIEARGEPYNAVIVRPIAKWLAQPGFLGFYALPAGAA